MRFDELTLYIQKKIWLRFIVFFLVRITTLREWYLSAALKKVLKRAPKEFSFLDAGCGMGQFAFRVARNNPSAKVTGFEQVEERVKDNNRVAAKRGLDNLCFHTMDISNLEQKDKYHIILCNSVLEHIHDDLKTLVKLQHALQKKGVLIIYVPSQEKRVLSALRRVQERQVAESKTGKLHEHVRYYSRDGLMTKARTAGFNILQATITYGTFGRWSYDLVTYIQYHRHVKLLFPLYLIFLHPAVMILMWLDMIKNNEDGNGLMLICQK